MTSSDPHDRVREELQATRRALQDALRDAANAVSRSENLLAVLFGGSPMPIALSRRSDGRIVDVNDEWSRLTGYSREQAVGRTAVELGLWSDAQSRERALRDLQVSGRVRNHEVAFVTQAGGSRVLLLDLSQIEIGDETFLVIYHTDVTSQRERPRLHYTPARKR